MIIGSHETHPVADEFPLMDEADLAALAADIKANGLLRKPVLYKNQILDGRNRYLACLRIGIVPEFRVIEEPQEIGDLVRFVVSENMHRRHLDPVQRALCVKRFLKLVRTRKARDRMQPALPHVPEVTGEQADALLADGTPELVAAVERGEVPLSVAAEASKLEPEQQDEMLRRLRAPEQNVDEPEPPALSSVEVGLSGPDLFTLRRGLAVWEQSSHGEVRAAAKLLRRIVPCL